jgi:hypothetical protein
MLIPPTAPSVDGAEVGTETVDSAVNDFGTVARGQYSQLKRALVSTLPSRVPIGSTQPDGLSPPS